MIYSRPWTNLFLLMAIKMVLFGFAAGAGNVSSEAGRVRRAPLTHHSHRVLTDEELDATAAWKRSHWREMQSMLQRGQVSECCPSVVEMVAPKGGRTPNGLFVELYEDGENKQQLYELSCAPNVADKPCRFVDARIYNQSRCVQKYSYSYALVRNPAATELPHRHRREGHFAVPGAGGWSMDYVRVRAGCECELVANKKKSHRRKAAERHLHRQRKRNRRLDEDDDT